MSQCKKGLTALAVASSLCTVGCQSRVPPIETCTADTDCVHLNVEHPASEACWLCAADHRCRLFSQPADTVCDTPEDASAPIDGSFSNDGSPPNDGAPSFCQADANPCSGSTPFCDEEMQTCVECLSASDCTDELFCNGAEVCNGGTCEAGANPCGPADVCVEDDDRCLPPSRVFLTFAPSAADFGGSGYQGALARCRSDAVIGFGEEQANFVPWLSNFSTSPTREPADDLHPLVGDERRFVRVDGTVIADNWFDLVDGELLAPINVHPDGTTLSGSSSVWTATTHGGQETSTKDCAGWQDTSSAQQGGVGDANATTASWSAMSELDCDQSFRLYCFEVFPADTSQRRVFLTSVQYSPVTDFTGISGAQMLCDAVGDTATSEASATWDAWISDGSGAGGYPASRFTPNDGPWVRMDGAMIALDDDDLMDGQLIAPILVDETETLWGTESRIEVWTATAVDGTAQGNNCIDWTTSNIGSFGDLGDARATTSPWTEEMGIPCNSSAHLYCFEQ